jgi:hypothetical protein
VLVRHRELTSGQMPPLFTEKRDALASAAAPR